MIPVEVFRINDFPKPTKNSVRSPIYLVFALFFSCCFTCGCNQSGKKNDPADSEAVKSGAFRVERKEVQVDYSLTDEQTKYLWDLEHHGNVLNKHGFGPLIQAVADGSKEDILNSLGEPNCYLIDKSEDTLAFKSEQLDLTRDITADDSPPKPATAEQFVDWLLTKRAMFEDKPRAKFYVRTILPPKAEETWEVKCIHRIWGKSKQGGQLEVAIHLDLKTYQIEKQRLDLGSWVSECKVTQVDVAQSTEPLFDLADPKLTGVFPDAFYDNWKETQKQINTGGVYACDYNRDGFTDMFVTDKREDGGKMFTGDQAGKFTEDTHFVKLESIRNCRITAFVDLDNDGWEDLICPGIPRVFRNLNGEKFVNYTGLTNFPLMLDLSDGSHNRISGVIPADFDLDGDLDLYITRSVENVGSWLQSVQPQLAHNQLLRNDGNWMFTDITQRTGADGEGRSTFSAVWTDVNNDRYPDLYMINEFGNGSLLVNQKGVKFEKQQLTPDQGDFGSMGLTCGDFNNDGNTDIYVSNMYSKAGSRVMGNMVDGTYPDDVQSRLRSMVAGGELYQNEGGLNFKPVGKDYQVHAAGWAWGSSLADLNNDGWLDLYVTAGFISRDRAKPDG